MNSISAQEMMQASEVRHSETRIPVCTRLSAIVSTPSVLASLGLGLAAVCSVDGMCV